MKELDYLVLLGILVTLVGLGMLLWCIAQVWKARKANLADEDLRLRVQSILPWNLGAMGLSGIGLMIIILGIIL